MDESIDRRTFLASLTKKVRNVYKKKMSLIKHFVGPKQINQPEVRSVKQDPSRCLVCDCFDCKCVVYRV